MNKVVITICNRVAYFFTLEIDNGIEKNCFLGRAAVFRIEVAPIFCTLFNVISDSLYSSSQTVSSADHIRCLQLLKKDGYKLRRDWAK